MHIYIIHSLNVFGCNRVRVRGGIVMIFSSEAHVAITHTHVCTLTYAYCVHGRAVNVLEANTADSTTPWTAEVDGVDAIKKNLTIKIKYRRSCLKGARSPKTAKNNLAADSQLKRHAFKRVFACMKCASPRSVDTFSWPSRLSAIPTSKSRARIMYMYFCCHRGMLPVLRKDRHPARNQHIAA